VQAAWGVDVLLQFATAAEQSTREQSIGAEDEWDALTRALDGSPRRPTPTCTLWREACWPALRRTACPGASGC
jgi:hypothetical protein